MLVIVPLCSLTGYRVTVQEDTAVQKAGSVWDRQ